MRVLLLEGDEAAAGGPHLPLPLPFAGCPVPDHSACRKTPLVRREHSIPADLARLKEARDFADRAAAEFGFPADVRYQIKLAVCEAVTNAIQHGSAVGGRSDPHLRRQPRRATLVFEVLDTGRFVPRVTRRGSIPESGRGLEFMRLMMDEVDVRPGQDGTQVRLVKRLQ